MLHFVFIGFVWFSLQTAFISLNGINQLIDVMVKCGVLFEVRTEFLNIIYTSFGFKFNIEIQTEAIRQRLLQKVLKA
jgi:hypothetical protein